MRVRVRTESWPIAGGFRIARGARAAAEVVVLEIEAGGHVGRGECVPYARFGESVDSVAEAIVAFLEDRTDPPARKEIQRVQPGAARNAVDCAIWDLEARRQGTPVWRLLGRDGEPGKVRTMRTISVDDPDRMAEAARRLSASETLKVKVDGGPDLERIGAVREASPSATLVVDANESWSVDQLEQRLPKLVELGVSVLEQPLPEGGDAALSDLRGMIPFCADESFRTRSSLEAVEGRYEIVNIKLDKAGGLTEALAAQEEAHGLGLHSMVGCMVATSLGIAPALLLADLATYVDLDGPLLLERDREGSSHDPSNSRIGCSAGIWGT